MRRWGAWAIAAALVAGALFGAPRSAALLSTSTATIDPVLSAALSAGGTVRAAAVLGSVATPGQVSALRAAGLDVTPLSQLPMVAVQGPPAAIRAAAALPFVRSLWGDHPLEEALQQSTTMIQADDAYGAPTSVTGAGIGIAVLDSGIDATHPDLSLGTKVVKNVKILGHTNTAREPVVVIEDVPNSDTTSGHGTHVAGIAAGSGTLNPSYAGVAPGADLIGVGSADGVEMLTALGGYDWILANRAAHNIRVINNSWADKALGDDPNAPLNVASKAAHDAGITVVFAAGNDGQASGKVYNRYAWHDWVVGVAGVDKLGNVGTYTSRGDAMHHPTLSAPGTFIASARAQTGIVGTPNQTPFDLTDPTSPRMVPVDQWPYYTVKMGSSMAAPHVAGVVALMLEANPNLTPDEVKAILASTATPLPCPVIDCGSGLVNALAAVQAARDARNVAPTAALAATITIGAAPLATTLDGSDSSDADGLVVSYRWDWEGDGQVDHVTSGPHVEHVYAAGSWRPTLTVVDDDGVAGAPASIDVRASDPPTAAASVPGKAKGGSTVTLDASASSDPDGSVVSYHFRFGDGTEIVSSSGIVTHVWSPKRASTYGWSVVVTDDAGITDGVTGSIKITP